MNKTLHSGAHVLIDALPAMKSSGVIQGASETDALITVLTSRHEFYDQYTGWCENKHLSSHQLPSFHEDCPTADSKHSEEWEERVISLYEDDVMPREIHKYVDQYFGKPVPCDDGQECP